MRCLHPHTRTYFDPVSRELRVTEYPCGKCIACLHNAQDSWAIRANETSKAFGSFIYDTLTFAPSSLPIRELDADELHRLDAVEYKHYRNYVDRSSGVISVPNVERKLIRDWIRRGRELFVYDHHYRPKWKYLIFEEYGPSTSRPHFHLLFWGCSRADYVKYLAKPWRQNIGFTRTKWVDGTQKKDRQCISRYISKYCSKGVFESPLVREGLSPKPFRSISHGIGEEYLRNSVFDWFKQVLPQFWKSLSIDTSREVGSIFRNNGLKYKLDHDFMEGFRNPSKEVLEALSCYRDERGLPHSLPRYYKMKLLGLFKPNLLSYAIQNLLLARAELQHNKALSEFAHSLGEFVGKRLDPEAPHLGLSRKLYDLWDNKYFAFQCEQAKAAAKRRYIELKNHYYRPMQNKAFAWAT